MITPISWGIFIFSFNQILDIIIIKAEPKIMTLLFLGLVLWTFCHSLKRIFPAGRNKLDTIAGVNGSKGILAIGVIISLVLIVIGYRSSNYVLLYNSPNFTIYINCFIKHKIYIFST